MSTLFKAPANDAFYKRSDLTPEAVSSIIQNGLHGADYGELYMEDNISESVSRTNAQTTVNVGNGTQGFSFRAGQQARVGFGYAEGFNKANLTGLIAAARNVLKGQSVYVKGSNPAPQPMNRYYAQETLLTDMPLTDKIKFIEDADTFARDLDDNVRNVSVTYAASEKLVTIVNQDGVEMSERRPYCSFFVTITYETEKGISEGKAYIGGRMSPGEVLQPDAYKDVVKDAIAQAKILQNAHNAPDGEMDVILPNGWGGILLHESVGHGLEGDFNRRGISVYSGKVGEKIAPDCVTIIDQGDIEMGRGSCHFDDEGTGMKKNVLVENGVLKGYMQDRQNAQLMGVAPTGNGRRQSYAYAPMPRMTNTYFAAGTEHPESMIASMKDGLIIHALGGGSVDITSGEFNMNATLAQRVRDGKRCEFVKSAALIGDGFSMLKNTRAVGSNLELMHAVGMCGKNGQSVPTSVGQGSVYTRLVIGG